MKCTVFASLENELTDVLNQLANIATMQVETFREGNDAEFTRLNHVLELTTGEKERVLGALQQHTRDHKCQPRFRTTA